jgi:hypothetical protein
LSCLVCYLKINYFKKLKMKYLLQIIYFFSLIALQVNAQHTNVLISDVGDPTEPSICLDPKNPNKIVAGANLNYTYRSNDAGATWVKQDMFSDYGVWGDPVIGVDTTGAFLYLHLSNPSNGNWIDRIVCQKSTNGGQTWTSGTYTGLNGTKAQDKHWIAIDPKKNYYYVTWTQFDQYGSTLSSDSSIILFSKSLDGGQTWSAAKRINKIAGDCIDKDNTVEGAVPTVGPNGEIYVTWAGPAGLMFDRSLDEGETWLTEDLKIGDFPGGWDYNVAGINRSNGLPVMVCDLSGGAQQGTIYVNWSDQRNGTNDTDVWLCKSTDNGNTWSAPTRVNNDPPGKQQFFTWMSIDQTNGWLWFVFYDRRGLSGAKTNVYMACSKDGGLTFTNFKVSETPFTPNQQAFFGDYTNLTAHNGIVRPIWARMEQTGASSIWTALVNLDSLNTVAIEDISLSENEDVLEQNYPNPASSETFVPFKIHQNTLVTLQIVNAEGKIVTTVFENKPYAYGKYLEKINLKNLGLATGQYWIVLSIDGKVMSKKMVVL